MQNVPSDTVDAWISKGKQLDPKRLIPAIVQYDHAKQRTQVSLSLNVHLWSFWYCVLSTKPCSHITFAVTATLKFALCQWSNTYSNINREHGSRRILCIFAQAKIDRCQTLIETLMLTQTQMFRVNRPLILYNRKFIQQQIICGMHWKFSDQWCHSVLGICYPNAWQQRPSYS